MNKNISVLMVCMGNICRSPTAQAVFEKVVERRGLSDQITIDSAGTHAYHVGEQPDRRSQSVALDRGIDMSAQRARQVEASDFDRFDYVLAMDKSNYNDLKRLASPAQRKKLHLFLDFAKDWDVAEVPDPYYGGSHGFERVLDMVESASEGLLEDILSR
ncbi:MAG TPA: low molecular weight phosphotyrosine protein phosphatase [Thiothrix sp.]|nr:low molecular weight phosphotyrosine protein phosphatase [Thiothrix sp.]